MITGNPDRPSVSRHSRAIAYAPAGRLHLSLEDWSRFIRLFIAADGSILSPETVELLLTTPPEGRMSMGWASPRGLDGVLVGMQGSNTKWSATELIDEDRSTAAMVVTNDGRTRVLQQTAYLAHRLLKRIR